MNSYPVLVERMDALGAFPHHILPEPNTDPGVGYENRAPSETLTALQSAAARLMDDPHLAPTKAVPAEAADGLGAEAELLLALLNDGLAGPAEGVMAVPICRSDTVACRLAEVRFMGTLAALESLADAAEGWTEGDTMEYGARIIYRPGDDGTMEPVGYQKAWGEQLVMITHPDGIWIGDKVKARPGSLVCLDTPELKATRGVLTTLPLDRVLGMRMMRYASVALPPDERDAFKRHPGGNEENNPEYADMAYRLTMADIHQALVRVLARRQQTAERGT